MSLSALLTDSLRPLYGPYAAQVTPYLARLMPYAARLSSVYFGYVHAPLTLVLSTFLAVASTALARVLPPLSAAVGQVLAFLLEAPPAVALAGAVALLLAAAWAYFKVMGMVRRATMWTLSWLVWAGVWGAVLAVAAHLSQVGLEQGLQEAGWLVGWVGEVWDDARGEGGRKGREGERAWKEYQRKFERGGW